MGMLMRMKMGMNGDKAEDRDEDEDGDEDRDGWMDGLELGTAWPMGHTSGQEPSPSSASLAWVSVRPWASSC